MSRVYVLKTNPETVLDDYARLLKMAGVSHSLDPRTTTILKDNISWHFPCLSANTTPWQLEGVIKGLREQGFSQITCVRNKTVVTNPFKGEKLNKYQPVLQKYGIPVLYNFRDADMKWVRYEPKGEMLALDRIFPEGIFIPDYFMGKNIVHLPTVKCHVYTTTTGAMKNAFGGLLNTKRHYAHSDIHKALVDLLMIQQEIHSGIFAVMDGTVCGSGSGPRTMTPVEKDYILAGDDQVAIDAIAAKMMGFDPMTIPYIRMAHERGLGVGTPKDIEVIGADIRGVNFGFRVGVNPASGVGRLLWFGPLRRLQHMFFHTPLVYLFILGSFLYHDYFWWPVKGRKRMEHLRAQGRWGKLFEDYSE